MVKDRNEHWGLQVHCVNAKFYIRHTLSHPRTFCNKFPSFTPVGHGEREVGKGGKDFCGTTLYLLGRMLVLLLIDLIPTVPFSFFGTHKVVHSKTSKLGLCQRLTVWVETFTPWRTFDWSQCVLCIFSVLSSGADKRSAGKKKKKQGWQTETKESTLDLEYHKRSSSVEDHFQGLLLSKVLWFTVWIGGQTRTVRFHSSFHKKLDQE